MSRNTNSNDPQQQSRATAVGTTAVTGSSTPAPRKQASAPQGAIEPHEMGVYGVIYRGNNRPLVGAHITLLDQGGKQVARTTADENGHYQFDLHNGGTYLMIVASDGVSPQASLVAVADRAVRRDVTLEGHGTITGRVLRTSSSGDQPVAEALVTLTDVSGEVVDSAHTAADGMYSFTGLVGGSYVLTAQSGRNRPQARMVELADGAVVATDLAMSPGGRVAGVVSLARDNQTLAGASVTLMDGEGQVVATTTTSEQGQYVFENVTAGQYTLVATGFAPTSQSIAVNDDQVSSVAVTLSAAQNTHGALQQAGQR